MKKPIRPPVGRVKPAGRRIGAGLLSASIIVITGLLIGWQASRLRAEAPAPATPDKAAVPAPHLVTAPEEHAEEAAAPQTPPPAVERAEPMAGPGVEPAPTYFPRDPQEWQGMLVNLAIHPACAQSSDCGLARACRDQVCAPCRSDPECAPGESCVLDHCLITARVRCRTRRDCPGGEQCMLNEFSSDPRNNAEMESFCSGALKPRKQEWKAPEVDDRAPVHPSVQAEELLKQLKQPDPQ